MLLENGINEAMSSRIFVRGIPPSCSQADFEHHFAQRFSVTDVRLLSKRRIGYVGFQNHEEATKAVKFFHRSFIRMSRLHVELAEAAFPAQDGQSRSSDRADLKRRRLAYRHNAETSSKAALPFMKQATNNKENGAIEGIEHTRDDFRGKATEEDAQVAQGEGDNPQNTTISIDDKNTAATSEATAFPDADWMRHRTNRLLDLVDDDEEGGDDGDTHPKMRQKSDTSLSVPEDDHNDTLAPSAPQRLEVPSLSFQDPLPNGKSLESGTAHGIENGRLFIRNLPFSAGEAELEELFQHHGPVAEVQVPRDFQTGMSKGFAFVRFDTAADATKALESLDGSVFMGRLLHILPASEKRTTQIDEFALSQIPHKRRKTIERKREATTSTFSWNSLFMNADAVIEATADRLGVHKSELLDPTSSDAGVKQAQAETHAIQDAKRYFLNNGVNLDSFSLRDRNGNAILVKNFKHSTKADDLKKLFAESGEVSRVLMPPSAPIAIVEFPNNVQAQKAFNTFAYRRYKDSVLFLERAPKNLFVPSTSYEPQTATTNEADVADMEPGTPLETSTLFIRNLNFTTTSARLQEAIGPLEGLVSARVKTKRDPKREGQTLSMGFAFLEFRDSACAKAAILALNGYTLDGHQLEVKASNKGKDSAAERKDQDLAKRRKQRQSKVIIKNLPFEASKKDVRDLFKVYGQLRTVRVPKKFDNSRRGFAFAEFATPKEAENAMDALRNTHLLGRRLVLQYATEDAEDPEEQIAKMQQKANSQIDSIALNNLAVNQRAKFIVDEDVGAG